MKKNVLVVITLLLLFPSSLPALELTGYMKLEGKYFLNEESFSDQRENSAAFSLQPEIYHEWGNDNSFIFTPFIRIDSADADRSHWDIREMIYQKVSDSWELRIGVGKVFWGVTEFFHLVDIINQTDLIEHLDGEEKLGQPMINLSLVQDWGVVDAFVLPFFRERTFPGRKGRLRSQLPIDTDRAKYEDENNIDLALRYSHSLGNWDFGIYHFAGTGREPTISLKINSKGRPKLIPYYEKINQTGLDVQSVYGNWLYKLEALHRTGQGESFLATVGGFEYTFVNVASSGIDLGVIGEWAWDKRNDDCTTIFDNDLMIGTRIAFNDVASSEILMGLIQDMNSSGTTFTIEASTRITDHWKINVDTFLTFDSSSEDVIHDLRNDDYVQVELIYYF